MKISGSVTACVKGWSAVFPLFFLWVFGLTQKRGNKKKKKREINKRVFFN